MIYHHKEDKNLIYIKIYFPSSNLYPKSNLLGEIVAYKYIPTTIGYLKMPKKRKTNEGTTHASSLKFGIHFLKMFSYRPF